ncbi:MAG: hypothetical protein JWQ86_1155 [Mycobacterium sp.]|jgi:hypothetical protein|nr:hypothetical protein [Mycobacterium sp.]MDT5215745.1 hypothetical protein [Mycobacterium sp.]MDT5388799.1 hypothetical protein [Mycobacterium sp.]MDT7758978.1 hypothetical protein [Mycobacterium sp.]
MKSDRLTRRLALVAGGSAIIAMGALTAGCSTGEKPSPSSTTTTTSVAPSPTEKSIDPSGGNKFTPPVTAIPAPTVHPGDHQHTG